MDRKELIIFRYRSAHCMVQKKDMSSLSTEMEVTGLMKISHPCSRSLHRSPGLDNLLTNLF
jgi:hypothetical protein